jgi:hypothetical protein
VRRRRGFLIGFGIAAAILLVVIGWQVYQMRDPCMTGAGGACPALADVRGIRYAVSSPTQLDIPPERPWSYGAIELTNVPSLASAPVMMLADIDPEVLLVARVYEEPLEPARYRLLLSVADDGFPPELCNYLVNEVEYEQCR